jgi:micrococcal nuclease
MLATRRFLSRGWQVFLKRGTRGRIVLSGLFLIFACCICSLPVAIFAPNDTPTPTAIAELGEKSQVTRTSAPTATQEPSTTPSPTNTPTPSDTPDVERTEAQVVKVVDGDTIRVKIDGETYTVRYIGIDTPETVHPSKPVEWMGPEAKRMNEQLVGGQTVLLEKDVSETDQYGRLLRYVYVDDLMVNRELVRLGFAQISTYPPDVKHVNTLLIAQEEAREAERGLWGTPPTPTPTRTRRPTATDQPTTVPTQAVTVAPTQALQPTVAPTQAATVAPTQAPQPTVAPTQAATVAPTQPPQPTEPPAPAPANVVISYIFYDGVVPQVESDEYAEIANHGGSAINLAGWRLNAGNPGQDFWFPSFDLQPGASCRVYTNEVHPESCGFSFGSGQAIWRNSGDCGYLFDASGAQVSEYCY